MYLMVNVFNGKCYNYDLIKDNPYKLFINGLYHHTVTKNYVEMEKYYIMAIALDDTVSMFNLAYYHQKVTKDYVKMENTIKCPLIWETQKHCLI